MLSQSFPMRIFPHICIPFSLYCLFYVPGAPIIKRGVQMVERELNRTLGKRREKRRGDLSSLFFCFFLFNFSPALYYLNAWKRLNRPPLPSPPPKKKQQQHKTGERSLEGSKIVLLSSLSHHI